jgi:hypothetical protein
VENDRVSIGNSFVADGRTGSLRIGGIVADGRGVRINGRDVVGGMFGGGGGGGTSGGGRVRLGGRVGRVCRGGGVGGVRGVGGVVVVLVLVVAVGVDAVGGVVGGEVGVVRVVRVVVVHGGGVVGGRVARMGGIVPLVVRRATKVGDARSSEALGRNTRRGPARCRVPRLARRLPSRRSGPCRTTTNSGMLSCPLQSSTSRNGCTVRISPSPRKGSSTCESKSKLRIQSPRTQLRPWASTSPPSAAR